MESSETIQGFDLSFMQPNGQQVDRNYIEFRIVAERQPAKEVNGIPFFADVEYIKIIPPGAKSWVERRARDSDRQQYARQYQAFKLGTSQVSAGGFPLEQWPGLLASQVAFFKSQNIHTVEQLSAIPDSSFSNFPMGMREVRQRAIDFLEAAKGQAPLIALRKENEALKSDVATLAAKVEQLLKTMEARPASSFLDYADEISDATLANKHMAKKKER